MKHILFLAIISLSLFFQSCKDNLTVPVAATRNYQQDAAALNNFVDINKTTYEYYINSNKRSSALSYITNADAEELNSVNPLNLDIFRESLAQVNHLSRQLTASHGVDYIVMITENDIYVNRIKSDSPVELKKKTSDGSYSSTVALLRVADYQDNYYMGETNHVETSVELNPHSYRNAGWAFLVTCEMGNGSDKETASVLFCGVGYHINPCFEWVINQGTPVACTFETTSLVGGESHIANFKFLD